MAVCGAKTRNSNTCKNAAMANGRCRMHGGKSTGAPKFNSNGRKHGIYSKFLSEEESQIANDFDLSQIDDELRLCKVRLMRALKHEHEQGGGEEALELISKITTPPIIGGVPVADDEIGDIVERTFSKKDYSPLIERLIARIQSLTSTRYQLMLQNMDVELKRIELDRIKAEQSSQDDDQLTINIVRVGE